MIIRWVIGVGLLFGILLMTLPKRDEASLAKISSQAVLMCTKDFRGRVAQKLLQKEVVDVEFKNRCPDLIASLKMDERGEMVITGNKRQMKMTLTPVVEGGKVRWTCHGEPAALMTKLCRT